MLSRVNWQRPPPISRPRSLETLDLLDVSDVSNAADVLMADENNTSTAPYDDDASADACMRPPALGLLFEDSPPVAAPTPRAGHRTSRRFSTFGFSAPAAPPMSLIAPRLYLGDEEAAASMETLLGGNVTHVLNCTGKPSPLEGAPGAPICHRLGLSDSSADLPYMQQALANGVDFIRTALESEHSSGSVLVHCHRGISRSATLVIAYLVQTTRQPVDTIFEAVRAKRPIVDPNLSYWIALQEWEQHVMSTSAAQAEGSFYDKQRTSPRRNNTPTASPRLVRRSASLRKTPTPPNDSPARPVRPLSRAG